ncbi:MAG: hypothetical protein IPM18_17985 [Phycisphaerales bacterium]|nr:hypothetical protein [Phycisphaerales bacterium]
MTARGSWAGRRNLTPNQAALLRGRRYNRLKEQHGGDRRSSPQNEDLKEKTVARLARVFLPV